MQLICIYGESYVGWIDNLHYHVADLGLAEGEDLFKRLVKDLESKSLIFIRINESNYSGVLKKVEKQYIECVPVLLMDIMLEFWSLGFSDWLEAGF